MRVLAGVTLYCFVLRCCQVVPPSVVQMSESGTLHSIFYALRPNFRFTEWR